MGESTFHERFALGLHADEPEFANEPTFDSLNSRLFLLDAV